MKLFLVSLLLSMCMTVISQVPKTSDISFNVLLQQEQHKFNVSDGPPRTRGLHEDQNINFGIGIKYNKKLLNRLNGSIGLGYIQYKSKIFRIYDQSFWGDLTAILLYTNNTKYNLIRIPIGFDYHVWSRNNMKIILGSSLTFSYALSQKYGKKGEQPANILRPYFFGTSNQLSVAFRRGLLKRKFIELRPFLNTYETWRKDEILFENKKDFHKMNFNAFGVNVSYGIYL